MLWTILGVILVLWLLGFIGSVGGSLIHVLLVVALVILAVQLLSGRRVACPRHNKERASSEEARPSRRQADSECALVQEWTR